jgi:DNA-binding NtrC family response regulator
MIYADDGHVRQFREIEADVIRLAMTIYGGHMCKVAGHLRIGRSTLYRKLIELGIHRVAAASKPQTTEMGRAD